MSVPSKSFKELDASLGGVLARATGAGQPPASVILGLLAKAGEEKISSPRVAMWLRFRSHPELHAILDDLASWRSLVAASKKKRASASSPEAHRLAVARRAVAALLSDLPAGEASLVALLAVMLLDDDRGWDTVQVSQKLAVALGCNHSSIQSRIKKLDAAGVITVVAAGRGVASRVRFRRLTPTASERFTTYPRATELVNALVATTSTRGTVTSSEATDALAIFRSVGQPSIAYGVLSDAAWQYALLRALGADTILSTGRRSRATSPLRAAGIDPTDPSAFADAARDLSVGEPTRLRDEAEAARMEAATLRAAETKIGRDVKTRVYRALELRGQLSRVVYTTSRGDGWISEVRDLRELVDNPIPVLLKTLPDSGTVTPTVRSLHDLLSDPRAADNVDTVLATLVERSGGAEGVPRAFSSTLLTVGVMRDALSTETGTSTFRTVFRGRALQQGHPSSEIAEALLILAPTAIELGARDTFLPRVREIAGAVPEHSPAVDHRPDMRAWADTVARMVEGAHKPTTITAIRAALRSEITTAGWAGTVADTIADRIFNTQNAAA